MKAKPFVFSPQGLPSVFTRPAHMSASALRFVLEDLPPTYPVRWKEKEPKVVVKKSKPPKDNKKKEKAWVEVTLLDLSGEPMSDAKYVMTLPGGKKKEGKLNKKGQIRVEDIDPEECSIEFPEMGIVLNRLPD